MKIHGIKCKHCGSAIYSRARHDYRKCECGKCSVDGGADYLRVSGNFDDFEHYSFETELTRTELYDDWNTNKNKFGLIKRENVNAKKETYRRRNSGNRRTVNKN